MLLGEVLVDAIVSESADSGVGSGPGADEF